MGEPCECCYAGSDSDAEDEDEDSEANEAGEPLLAIEKRSRLLDKKRYAVLSLLHLFPTCTLHLYPAPAAEAMQLTG